MLSWLAAHTKSLRGRSSEPDETPFTEGESAPRQGRQEGGPLWFSGLPFNAQEQIDFWKFGCSSKAATFSLRAETDDMVHFGQLQRALARNKSHPYWSGNCWKDYFFWVANQHPLLGLLFSHPWHPFSKRERLAVLICVTSFTVLPAAILSTYLEEKLGEHEVNLKVMDLRVSDLFYDAIVFVTITLPVALFEKLLYAMSILDIFCIGRGRFCNRIAKGYACFRHYFIFSTLLFAIFIVAVSFHITHSQGHEVHVLLKPFSMSRLQSWLIWFPSTLLKPCKGFLCSWCWDSRRVRADYTKADVSVITMAQMDDGMMDNRIQARVDERTVATRGVAAQLAATLPSSNWQRQHARSGEQQ